jgi:hypothetical protein
MVVRGDDPQQRAHRAVGEIVQPAAIVEIVNEVEDTLEVLSRDSHIRCPPAGTRCGGPAKSAIAFAE